MSKKVRVDILLVDQGLVESRSKAQRLIMAGQVRADGQVVFKPASKVLMDVQLTIDIGARFVSRGGEKLQAAFDAFSLDVCGKICADVGSSTGGFTDCLLQNEAKKVFAIDVGKGILHWKLRQDRRVVVMEETNARFVELLPEKVDFVSIDASFISLKVLLPVVKSWGDGEVIALIKPQFEAGRREAARGKGVIRDTKVHHKVLSEVLSFAESEGFVIRGLILSPIIGPKGNLEFLAYLSTGLEKGNPIVWRDLISAIIPLNEN